MDGPEWWRGESPGSQPRGRPALGLLTGKMDAIPQTTIDRSHPSYFFKAEVTNAELWLNHVHLAVAWSVFDNCHFPPAR